MYISIMESISVAGTYASTGFTPKKFLWKRKTYPIDTITLITNIKDGGVLSRMYSVVSQNNMYRLLFNRTIERWTLMEVWCE